MARTKKAEKETLYTGTGRRKSAVARVFLYVKKGDVTVNGKAHADYFTNDFERTSWLKPFHIVGVSHPESVYSASVKVEGSGKMAQMDAIVLGFARALAKANPEFREALRTHGFLTRDPREVERKKYFLRKARKSPQYSKR